MNYETVIGIEIHCELKTKTKMFSSAPVSFGETANTCVNEIDLGHPGTLPCVNKEAVRLAIKAATALNCTIDPLVKFDRKNYYYSDLPKDSRLHSSSIQLDVTAAFLLIPKMARKKSESTVFIWRKIPQNSSTLMLVH